MSARDLYHDAVKNALVKEGWTITHDPLRMQLGNPGANVYVDLAAERILVAERENQKIAVEVKSFLGISFIADLHDAVGQFIVYLSVLEEIEPERVLYLALSQEAYEQFRREPIARVVLEKNPIRLLVCDMDAQEVVLWHP